MPLTKQGKKVMASVKGQYGDKKGESIIDYFYAMINKKKKGSNKWHEKK